MKKKYNIVFMGTPEFAVPPLKRLNEDHNVDLVICQPDKANRRGKKVEFGAIKQYAVDNGLEVYQPEDINSVEVVNFLKNREIDFIVVVAYGQLIGKAIRDLPKDNIVNIHASILPKYRGAAPINWSIINRDAITGISIMKVDKGLDKGNVYLTAETTVDNKNYPELYDELSILGGELIIEYLRLYSEGSISEEVQEESCATYAPKVSKELGKLNFNDKNIALGLILGLTPRPGANCIYKDDTLKIHDAEVLIDSESQDKDIGEIISVSDKGIDVNCGNGILRLKKIQFPGKKILEVKEYLAGNKIELGEILR